MEVSQFKAVDFCK